MFERLNERLGDSPLISTMIRPAYEFFKKLMPKWHSPMRFEQVGPRLIVRDAHCDAEIEAGTFSSGLKINPSVRCNADIWQSLVGFKDGIVIQTGEESKIYQCDGNITYAEEILSEWGELRLDWAEF